MIYMAKTTYLEVFLPYMRILFCDDDSRILEQLQKYVCEFLQISGGHNLSLPHTAVAMSFWPGKLMRTLPFLMWKCLDAAALRPEQP